MNVLHHLYDASAPETAGEKTYFRLFELTVVLFCGYLAWIWGFYLARLQDLPDPVGLGIYVDLSLLAGGSPPLVAAAACCLLLLGGFLRWYPGAIYSTAFVLMHLLYVARHSLGKVTHGGNFIGMALLAVALGMIFFYSWNEKRRFAIGFATFSVGLGYVLSASAKLVASGPAWVSGHNLWLWIGEKTADMYAATGVFEYNGVQEIILASYPLATVLLSMGLLAEALGFLFWWSTTRPWIATALIGMHLGIAVAMNILFSGFIIVLLLLGYPWPRLFDRILATSPRARRIADRFI